MKLNRFNILFSVLALSILIFPAPRAAAQALRLAAPSTSMEVGESVVVSLSLNTQSLSVNTVSATIQIPPAKFEVRETRYGNSIISLWVEKPALNAGAGTVAFTGGVPGGFAGSNGPLLSLVLKAKQTGEAAISLKNVSILLNDGQGTEVKNPGLANISFVIREAAVKPAAEIPEPSAVPPQEEKVILPRDSYPPESFELFIASDESVAQGKLFASFNAVDKDTGVDRYEAYERPWLVSSFGTWFDSSWGKVSAPYVLRHQWWPTEVIVKAVDQAGNAKEARAYTPLRVSFMAAAAVLGMAVGGGAAALYLASGRRPRRRMV